MAKLLDCRAAAALCLTAVNQGASLSQQLPLFEQRVADKDRSLFRQLCYGVLRFQPKLQTQVKQLLSKQLKDKDQDLLMLLMLGGYQLFETRIPEHAAVDATVAAAQALKKPWAKNMVNGVLREWQRQSANLLEGLTEQQRLAHPKWLYKAINKAWPEHASVIMDANNQHPPMCLRINSQHTDRASYIEALREVEVDAVACDFATSGLRLTQAVPVDRLPGFFEGLASVQDEAPQLSAQLLELKPGQRVLDTCCAPGGKTCHMLEEQPELAEVIGLDIDADRLERVQQNLDRLQLNAQLICADAGAIDEWWDGQPFDRLLLDAPCSATGVIRRNPDIKLHRNRDDITQLSQLQLSLLQQLWPTLKPGGLLLYATCSILPDENERVVQAFCENQADAQHRAIDAPWGLARPYGRQLFPTPDGHDGFFYALIEKTST